MTTIYLFPEDDIAKVAARLIGVTEDEVVLVFPKKSYLFSDSINLRLLKKQVDILKKRVYIFTMDEMGQAYAKEAGFELKFLAQTTGKPSTFDVKKGSARPIVHKASIPISSDPVKPKRRIAVNTPLAPAAKPAAVQAPHAVNQSRPRILKSTPVEHIPAVRLKPTTKVSSTATMKVGAGGSTIPVRSTDTMFGDTLQGYETLPPEPRRYRGIVGVFVALALIIIIILVTVILPKADIDVYAKSNPLIRDVEVGLAAAITGPDADKLVMPALAIDQTIKGTKTFSSTGKKEIGSKAEGKIMIYNLTGKPLNLKASTTTLTIGSKNYYFTQDQGPLKPSSSGELAENHAEIIAELGGEDYNVPAGTRIEITNKVFGGKPQLLYGKTETALVGGNSRFISYITEADTLKSKQDLRDGLLGQLRGELKQKGLVLLDQAFSTQDVEVSTDKPAGTESPTIEVNAVIRIKGLVFNEQQLKDLVRVRLAAVLQSDERLQEDIKDIAAYRIKTIDLETKVFGLIVHYESASIGQISAGELTGPILGKSKEEASSMLLSNSAVDRVDITLSPGWQNSIPRFSRNVNLLIKDN